MIAFLKTGAVAASIYRRAHNDHIRHRALTVLNRLSGCEAALAVQARIGGPQSTPRSKLRELIAATREHVGPAWLAAYRDDPAVARFISLEKAPEPPDPGTLDDIFSSVLTARFARELAHSE